MDPPPNPNEEEAESVKPGYQGLSASDPAEPNEALLRIS